MNAIGTESHATPYTEKMTCTLEFVRAAALGIVQETRVR